MKNYPLTSIKVPDETFKKLQKAVELSGKDVADVRRICLSLGLDSYERMGYNIEKFAADCLNRSESPSIPMLATLSDVQTDAQKEA